MLRHPETVEQAYQCNTELTDVEAVQVIEDAGREFLGGPEQALVAIAKADLSLARGEADAALAILK